MFEKMRRYTERRKKQIEALNTLITVASIYQFERGDNLKNELRILKGLAADLEAEPKTAVLEYLLVAALVVLVAFAGYNWLMY